MSEGGEVPSQGARTESKDTLPTTRQCLAVVIPLYDRQPSLLPFKHWCLYDGILSLRAFTKHIKDVNHTKDEGWDGLH